MNNPHNPGKTLSDKSSLPNAEHTETLPEYSDRCSQRLPNTVEKEEFAVKHMKTCDTKFTIFKGFGTQEPGNLTACRDDNYPGKDSHNEEQFFDTPDTICQTTGTTTHSHRISCYMEKDKTDGRPNSENINNAEGEDGPSFSFQKKVPPPPVKPERVVLPAQLEESNHYPMDKNPRGYFLLINNKDFLEESTMKPYPRNGTDVDAAKLEDLFEELGYIVFSYRNQSCNQIKSAVKRLVNLDFTKVSGVACCFLSHGKEGILYGTDGEIEIRDLTSYFREKRDLVGKPKMFFFQACQGSEYMDSIEPYMEVDGPGDSYGNDISLPTEADFLYAYSTVPGYYSWRNSLKGSWFVQAIDQVFRQYAHKIDVVRMLTRVNQIVSSKASSTGQYPSHNKRQICSIITQLRYELYLFPPHGPLKAEK